MCWVVVIGLIVICFVDWGSVSVKLSCCFDWCFRLFLRDRLVTRWIGVLG